METLTSAQGSIGLAIAALLLVLGFRLVRPERGREWAAVSAHAASLAATFAAGAGLLPGSAAAPGTPIRLAGGAVLLAGLLLAGAAARARRPPRPGAPAPAGGRGAGPRLHAGLALVLLGYLLRAPSLAGAIATATALVVHAWAGRSPARSA